jgi:hypothetical protein
LTEIMFRLAKPLPLPNRVGLGRTMFAAAGVRKEVRRKLAAEIWAALGCRLPVRPFGRARIMVERHGIREPDEDNLRASVKALFDVLQPATANRAYGLGIIAGDDKRRLEQQVVHVRAAKLADQCTLVRIFDLSQEVAGG